MAIGVGWALGLCLQDPSQTTEAASPFETPAKVIAALAGIAALWKFAYEMTKARQLARDELRWRRANAAREILAELHQNQHACDAVALMDGADRAGSCRLQTSNRVLKFDPDVLAIVRAANKGGEIGVVVAAQKDDELILEAFDWFLYYLDRLEHYLGIKLVLFEDIGPVLRPYVQRLLRHADVFEPFMQARRYDMALVFLNEFSRRTSELGAVTT